MAEGTSVPWSSVEHYLGAGQATRYRLSQPAAHPEISYVVDDGGTGIALHVELDGRHRAPRSPLSAVHIDQIAERGMRMARIRTTQAALLRDFHDLVNAVADRMVTHDRSLDQALAETVRAWSALLDRPRNLGTSRRIGLIGELSVMAAVAISHGWPAAVDSWKGPESEEHDFGLSDLDIEVKTTAGERRAHGVHGLDQLTPNGDRPLWLYSMQITRGGVHGRTLSDCVHSVRRQVAGHSTAALASLDRKLGAVGWDPNLPDDERWHLRSPGVPLLVNDALPRLSRGSVPPEFQNLIRDVTYTIDVTGMEATEDAPAELIDVTLP